MAEEGIVANALLSQYLDRECEASLGEIADRTHVVASSGQEGATERHSAGSEIWHNLAPPSTEVFFQISG